MHPEGVQGKQQSIFRELKSYTLLYIIHLFLPFSHFVNIYAKNMRICDTIYKSNVDIDTCIPKVDTFASLMPGTFCIIRETYINFFSAHIFNKSFMKNTSS